MATDTEVLSRLRALREPAPAPEQGEAPATPAPDAPAPEPTLLSATPEPAEAAPEEPSETPELDAGAEPDDSEVDAGPVTLQTLAEHLDVDVADLYSVRMPVTLNGASTDITLGEYKDNLQSSEQVRRLQEQANKEREALETQRQELQNTLQQRLTETEALIAAAESELTAEMQGIDWQDLRAADPAEYATRRIEYQEKQAKLREMRESARKQLEDTQQEAAKGFQEKFAKHLAHEMTLLTEAIPEWRGPEQLKSGQAELVDYLAKTYGYGNAEMSGIADHRLLVIARKAMLYDQMQQSGGAVAKKVERVKLGSKVLKPGGRQSVSQQSQAQEKRLRAQLKKTGKMEDALALRRHLRSTQK